MAEDLLKAGEFAHLCGTTKETLRHYKDIGLLAPVMKAENGYQLYSPLQISDYLLISSLQQAGCSLQEIKGYLSNPDAEALETVIEDRIKAIAEQRRTLLSQKLLLENTLARTRARNHWRSDPAEYKLETCDTEYFLDSGISDAFVSVVEGRVDPAGEGSAVADEQARRIVRHILDTWKLDQQQGDVSELQGNYRVGRAAFLSGEPWKDFHICTRVRPRKRQSVSGQGSLIEKPAGTYFKYLRVVNFGEIGQDEAALNEALFDVYREMKQVLDREGFTPTSDVFERELSLYTGRTSEPIYSELSVRISE